MKVRPRFTRAVVLTGAVAALAVVLGATAVAGTNGRSRSTVSGNLTIWCWGAARDSLKVVDDGFKRAFPGIELNYVTLQPSDLYQKVQLSVAAGSGFPDVSCLEDSHLSQIVKLGALADITSKAAPYLKSIAAPFKWDASRLNGRYYAFPWDAGPVVLFYRRSVFKRAGVDAASIQTWNDYYQAGLKTKKLGVPIWIQSKAQNDGRFYETLLWQQGSGYVDTKGNVTIDKDPRALKALQFMGKMWHAGVLGDQAEWTDPWYTSIGGAKVATLPMAQWMSIFLKSWLAPKTKGDWGVVPLPAWTPGGIRSANDGGSALGIFKSSDNQDAAWQYIRYHLARADTQSRIYQTTDYFPSLTAAFNTPYVRQPDPYYGGQRVHLVFTQALKQIPEAHVYSSDYQQMNALMSTEIQKFALGKETAQQALKNAAKEIRARTGRH
jgi:lactose/L-arabinose transport system substrate-binding protein